MSKPGENLIHLGEIMDKKCSTSKNNLWQTVGFGDHVSSVCVAVVKRIHFHNNYYIYLPTSKK